MESTRAIPVLMYHHVAPHKGDTVTLAPEEFEAQLGYLASRGYHTLFIDEVAEFIRSKRDLPARAVALTFDDGYLDNWVYAFPLLKKYGAKATIFLVTSWVGEGEPRGNMDGVWSGSFRREDLPAVPAHRDSKAEKLVVNWSEARRMEQSGLVRCESHTHRHRDMEREDPRQWLEEDLRTSRSLLREKLGGERAFLAWPWGKYNDYMTRAAREQGFSAALTVEKGPVTRSADPMRIPRIAVKRGDVSWFAARLFIYSRPLLGTIYGWWRG